MSSSFVGMTKQSRPEPIFFVIFVPETKGVSLEKIEANLLSGLPLKQIGRSGAGLTHEPSHHPRHRFGGTSIKFGVVRALVCKGDLRGGR
jgi:hypothetical protein